MPNVVTRDYTARAVVAEQSLAAGAAQLQGTEINTSTTFGGKMAGRIANGGSAPTAGAIARLMIRTPGGTWIQEDMVVGQLGANAVTDFVFVVQDVGRATVYFDSPTGNAVTVQAAFHENTSMTIT